MKNITKTNPSTDSYMIKKYRIVENADSLKITYVYT